jgi:phosphoglycerate kinase
VVINIQPTFQNWQCDGSKILLRADLNVPLVNGTIIDDRRLTALLPTLDFLLGKKAMVLIATHIGRPESADPALSTRNLVSWFTAKNYQITFVDSIEKAQQAPIKPGTILLLENLRFDPREKGSDNAFATELKKLADWYVLDAFGALHRTDSSLALLAQQYDTAHRSIGFLIEKEIGILNKLLVNPEHPSCFIIGGGKVDDKLPLIKQLFGIADTIIVCPAIAFTFLKAMAQPVGVSLVDDKLLEQAREIITQADKQSIQLLFPVDYQIAQNDKNGPLSYVTAADFPANGFGMSIGPKTVEIIRGIIAQSKTVFYNGAMGFPERIETLAGIDAIITAMAQSHATTIV